MVPSTDLGEPGKTFDGENGDGRATIWFDDWSAGGCSMKRLCDPELLCVTDPLRKGNENRA